MDEELFFFFSDDEIDENEENNAPYFIYPTETESDDTDSEDY